MGTVYSSLSRAKCKDLQKKPSVLVALEEISETF